ncbi:hypothetical protein CR152_27070 [Massilia violaceinigra]|uniref:Uncharacterized protein n=1 Tax=Massilia violaceinigra TaxID=2045208 RepID=A0A2D2DS07_9BURK|nr:hypothetical protein [Massilia violaceinigra]ATQ77754.1 hypothetical protein CR152_27070 [Massilia violaceinigra]
MNTLTWLLKREYWEHKGSFLRAPAILAIVMVAVTVLTVGFGIGSSDSPFRRLLTGTLQGQALVPGALKGVADVWPCSAWSAPCRCC